MFLFDTCPHVTRLGCVLSVVKRENLKTRDYKRISIKKSKIVDY